LAKNAIEPGVLGRVGARLITDAHCDIIGCEYTDSHALRKAAVPLRAEPDAEGEITGRLEPGTRVQVTAVGWDADPAGSTDQAGGQWWYYVETNTAADGWVLPEMLNWEDRTPG